MRLNNRRSSTVVKALYWLLQQRLARMGRVDKHDKSGMLVSTTYAYSCTELGKTWLQGNVPEIAEERFQALHEQGATAYGTRWLALNLAFVNVARRYGINVEQPLLKVLLSDLALTACNSYPQ